MTEILTESFCERCGTRYTFETARPRNSRVNRAKTFTKGIRNFVLSDDPLSVAMADARGEEELAATVLQLDAFHKTFNFCLSCRQYTCGNCWNVEEGRCLSCAPRPEPEPSEEDAASDAIASRLAAIAGSGPAAPPERQEIGIAAWPMADLQQNGAVEMPVDGATHGTAESPVEAVAVEPAAESIAPTLDEVLPAGTDVSAEAAVEMPVEPVVDHPAADGTPPVAPVVAATAAAAALAPEAAPAEAPQPIVQGLQPGVSLEDAIAAYEAAIIARELRETGMGESHAEPEAEAVLPAEPVAPAEPEPVAATEPEAVLPAEPEAVLPAEPELAPDAALAAEAGTTVELEPISSAPSAPEPESLAAAPAAGLAAAAAELAVVEPASAEAIAADVEPIAAHAAPTVEPVAADVGPVAAELTPVPIEPAPAELVRAQAEQAAAAKDTAPVEAPAQPAASSMASGWLTVAPDDGTAPVWPQRPSWPAANRPPITGGTFGGRQLLPNPEAAALWAASAREVLQAGPLAGPSGAPGHASTPTPQPCVGCGLPLSANARFCRRCGTRQG